MCGPVAQWQHQQSTEEGSIVYNTTSQLGNLHLGYVTATEEIWFASRYRKRKKDKHMCRLYSFPQKGSGLNYLHIRPPGLMDTCWINPVVKWVDFSNAKWTLGAAFYICMINIQCREGEIQLRQTTFTHRANIVFKKPTVNMWIC